MTARIRSTTRDERLNVAIFVAIALIGGGNPVGVAIVVDELDPIWAAAFRFLAAGAIFAVAMLVLRVPIPRGRALIGSFIYGVLGFFGAFTFLFWGLQETPPGTTQIIIALVPLLTIVLAVAHGLERFSLRALIGVLIAFGGLVFLFYDRIQADVPILSMLAIVAGAAFLAESAVVVKLTPRAHPVASNAVGMLGGGLLLLALSAAHRQHLAAPDAIGHVGGDGLPDPVRVRGRLRPVRLPARPMAGDGGLVQPPAPATRDPALFGAAPERATDAVAAAWRSGDPGRCLHRRLQRAETRPGRRAGELSGLIDRRLWPLDAKGDTDGVWTSDRGTRAGRS